MVYADFIQFLLGLLDQRHQFDRCPTNQGELGAPKGTQAKPRAINSNAIARTEDADRGIQVRLARPADR